MNNVETLGDDAGRHLRLRAQGLARPASDVQPEALVAALIGVQAQDMPGAELSLWARSADLRPGQLGQAIGDRRVVRTWAMRGALHLLAGSDVRWVLAAISPALTKPSARHAGLGLDSDTFAGAESILRAALHGGQRRTRAELGETLRAHGIAPDGQRLPHILGYLSLQGVLCQGPPCGTEPTYVLLDEWIPADGPVERTDALGRLARRYLTGYGSAHVRDFAWWSGLPLSDARMAWDLIMPEITAVIIRGTRYAVLGSGHGGSASTSTRTAPNARLLPGFDSYMLGYKDRGLILDPAYTKRVNAGGGMLKPTVVVNGCVVGVWGRTIQRRRLGVTVTLFVCLAADAADAVADEAVRLGRFLELETDLTVSGPE